MIKKSKFSTRSRRSQSSSSVLDRSSCCNHNNNASQINDVVVVNHNKPSPLLETTWRRRRFCFSSIRSSSSSSSRRLSILATFILFLVVTSSSSLILVTILTEKKNVLVESSNQRDHATICTFQDLQQAFGTTTTTTTAAPKTTEQDQCWSLSQNVLRIPIDAIINRNHMTPLGSGYSGGVYKGLIQLKNHNDDDRKTSSSSSSCCCWAAVKTDHCHTLGLFHNKLVDPRGISCLMDGTILWNDASYMGGEYTGALVYGWEQYTTGILPTYGVIMANNNNPKKRRPLYSRVPRSWLKRNPHPDRSVLGVVMPFLENFVPLTDIIEGNNNKATTTDTVFPNVTTTANILLSAVQGLQYIHELGFANQDLQQKNVGILVSKNKTNGSSYESFIYDNTYFAKVTECRRSNGTCNFCDKDDGEYLSESIYHTKSTMDPQDRDVHAMMNILIGLTKKNSPQQQQLLISDDDENDQRQQQQRNNFHTDLRKCNTSADLVQVLMRYSRKG